MNKFRLNIDGKEVVGLPGQTILDVARENDIDIPTLCFDERTNIYGACGLCVVEIEGMPKLVKACATEISPNMVVNTGTDRVIESRKTNLELLLSNHVGDCRPPCVTACPAQTDCQGYVGLLANGEFEEAIELVRNKIPIPASIGRVCPHPCEDACRRGLIDEPVSIQWIKRYLGDRDLEERAYVADVEPDTGKKIAVIGAGPMGISAAFFLRQKGHEVTIYEAMPKAGGMLRYGIPEYRLPKEVLDDEIYNLQEMGIDIIYDTKVGIDVKMDSLREEYDAIVLAIGAWLSTGVGAKGEEAEGIIGGIDFLRKVVRNEPIDIGKNVAIIGGGNTAMDACRTSVRLGAENVYNIYRRTKDEMPADRVEIIEGEEEGVIFKNLTNPLEYIADENGRVKQIVLQVMKLGEPDESGRRRPVPVEGKTETIDVDTVLLAIGQAVDSSMFDEFEKTKRGAIAYDSRTFRTSVPGVFAGGDCGNDKISIAIEAIADAKKVSLMVDSYLNGEDAEYQEQYIVERDDITEETFADREKQPRPHMEHMNPEDRKNNFLEVIPEGYSEEAAMEEASRCLECGCHDYFECKLIDFARQYEVEPARFDGDKNAIEFEDDHPFIVRDPNKCILCGLCVRVCDEVMGVGALGLVNRGFDTVVKPNLEKPLAESGCISCGQCVNVCPVGALQERQSVVKEVPVATEVTETTCSYCSVGCSMNLESCGDMLVKAVPSKEGWVNKGLSCGKGKWGFDCSVLEGKIDMPLLKVGDTLKETDYHDAIMVVAKKAQAIKAKYGEGSIAVSISDRYTNEEAYSFLKMAQTIGAKTLCFNNRKSGLEEILGINASPNTIDELLSTDVILATGFNISNNPVIHLKLKQAAERGSKVVLINPIEHEQSRFEFAAKIVRTENDLNFLKQIAKAVIESGKGQGIVGYDEYVKSLSDVKVEEEAAEVAKLYIDAKKAMITFMENFATTEAAKVIASIALTSGHIGKPRDGILAIKSKNNTQGLLNMGVVAGEEAIKGVKALLIFGEDLADVDLSEVEFLMVSDTHHTDTTDKADVILPSTGFASTYGTYTNTERRLLPVAAAIEEGILFENWELASEIAHVFERDFSFESIEDISREMDETVPLYRYAQVGEILGGVLIAEDPKLLPIEDAKFVEPKMITDNLMNMIMERMPKSCPHTMAKEA